MQMHANQMLIGTALWQEYSSNLGEVVDIVVSHQGLPLKMDLVLELMNTVVVPAADAFRQQLQRFACLGLSAPSFKGHQLNFGSRGHKSQGPSRILVH